MTYALDEDCELPPHLVKLFLRTTPPQVQELLGACERRDADATRALAHKLKGGLYAAGASRLAERLETLRMAAVEGDWSAVQSQLGAIKLDIASVFEQLEAQALGGAS